MSTPRRGSRRETKEEPPDVLREDIRKKLIDVKKSLTDILNRLDKLNNKIGEVKNLIEKGE